MPTTPPQANISGLRRALARAMAQLKPMAGGILRLRFLEGLAIRDCESPRHLAVRVAVIVHRHSATAPQGASSVPFIRNYGE